MSETQTPVLELDEARLATAAGVIMEWHGLTAIEAFGWLEDQASITGIPVLDLADLIVHDAIECEAAPRQ